MFLYILGYKNIVRKGW